MEMDKAPKETVDWLLEKVRECIRSHAYSLVPRQKSKASMAKLGISIPQMEDEILELTYANYYRGPLDDWDRPNSEPLWEFRRIINGVLIYIKLKYCNYTKEKTVLVLSFHEDEESTK